jgi:hypothetical protein
MDVSALEGVTSFGCSILMLVNQASLYPRGDTFCQFSLADLEIWKNCFVGLLDHFENKCFQTGKTVKVKISQNLIPLGHDIFGARSSFVA